MDKKERFKSRNRDFSTREDLRLVHQVHFENTARARKNVSEVDIHQLEP